jgi:hypothetical protein
MVFTAWSNFYIITGSSAAALTGLMFVVVSLTTQSRFLRQAQDANAGFSAFSTPTVVHFCAAFFISGVLSAPWTSREPAAVLVGLTGLAGIAYVLRAIFSAARLTSYKLLLEDWVWFAILPFAAYGATVAATILLLASAPSALFVLAGATMLLIFIGIRNAWDIVTYLVVDQIKNP